MIPYQPGHCSNCNAQVWIKDAIGRLVAPMPILREGYLVFSTPKRYLKIPVCEACEKNLQQGNFGEVIENLVASKEAMQFRTEIPVSYEDYETHWASRGKNKKGIWRIFDERERTNPNEEVVNNG